MVPLKTTIATTMIWLTLAAGYADAEPKPRQDLMKPVGALGTFVQGGGDYNFLRTSLLSYASQWGFVFIINRSLGQQIRSSNFEKWLKNVTTLPRLPDGDGWVTNYVGHPLMGATFYAVYRDRGLTPKQSIAGAFLQSTLFEYTVEAWKQPPSAVDLIITPLVGSFIGARVGMKAFYLSSSYALGRYVLDLF